MQRSGVHSANKRCIKLCEIKFHNAAYTLTAEEAAKLQRKKAAFLTSTQTRKALFLTLITVNGVTRNPNYLNSPERVPHR